MRWLIFSLLFFGTTINYRDRAISGVILPEIRDRFSLRPSVAWNHPDDVSGRLCGRFVDRGKTARPLRHEDRLWNRGGGLVGGRYVDGLAGACGCIVLGGSVEIKEAKPGS